MARSTGPIAMPAWIGRVSDYQSLFVPVASIGMLAVIVIPMPSLVIDILITANIALAALILVTTIYVDRPLDFSVFPSLLLGTTLFRLVLNIATTRLILGAETSSPEEAEFVAGEVIATFASFVAGGDIVVGLIIFAILIVVQFVVITKGSTRISEVAARFTLDGMPGKQMAIDADLNAGMINEAQARQRREDIAQEADFYGAMDGAAKFVRGDAIAGIIITLVNIGGGLLIGVFSRGWDVSESLDVFTRLTIGDGLVTQLPAFVISIAAGLIVTRSSGRQQLSAQLTEQLTGRAAALGVTAVFLTFMAFTGLPPAPMLTLAMVAGSVAWFTTQGKRRDAQALVDQQEQQSVKAAEPTVDQMLGVDTMELEVGYGLVRLVDAGQGGDLLDRIALIRRQLAAELGMVMPPVRIRDNMQLPTNHYNIRIRGATVSSGMVIPGRSLAIDSGVVSGPIEGVRTREPTFGLEAVWIEPGQKDRAESLNYTVVDTTGVLATHLTEVVKQHAAELLTREETNNLLTQLREKAPKLHEEVFGGDSPLVKPGEMQRVLQNLLREGVPIRDLETVAETLGDWVSRTRDFDILTEYVRNALRRTICAQYVEQPSPDGMDGQDGASAPRLYCVSIDPGLEDQIAGFIEHGSEGSTMTMPPQIANRVTQALVRELQTLVAQGRQPVLLASPQVRMHVKRLLESQMPSAAVLGFNEISKGVEVESVGLAQMEEAANVSA